jgi:iron complex transport system substrate-binding protein
VRQGYYDGSRLAVNAQGGDVKRIRHFLKSLLLAQLMLGVAAAQALTVKDDLNRVVRFERSPLRVVSMLPSLTESVCALKQCHRLIGVDRYSNFPVSVKKLLQLGGGLDPNIEAIVALKPDVVLMAGSSKGYARLAELGVRVVLLEPKNQADVLRSLQVLGDLFEIPAKQGAQAVWAEIEQGIRAAAKTVPNHLKSKTVYFEAGAPYAAGEASFVGELLTALGLNNIVPASMGPFPALNSEFVVVANPSVIMLGETGLKELAGRPGWSKLSAIRERRVCSFSAAERDMLVRPGPRMVQGAQIMVECLKKLRR